MEMSLDAAGTKIKRPQTLLIQQSKIITGLIWLVPFLGYYDRTTKLEFWQMKKKYIRKAGI